MRALEVIFEDMVRLTRELLPTSPDDIIAECWSCGDVMGNLLIPVKLARKDVNLHSIASHMVVSLDTPSRNMLIEFECGLCGAENVGQVCRICGVKRD